MIAPAGESTPATGQTIEPVIVANIAGPILPNAPITLTWKWDHIPSLRIHTSGGAVRARVAMLEGTNPSLTFAAMIWN